MAKRTMPRGLKKYIRKEKARIRRQFLDINQQKQEIAELYKRLNQ